MEPVAENGWGRRGVQHRCWWSPDGQRQHHYHHQPGSRSTGACGPAAAQTRRIRGAQHAVPPQDIIGRKNAGEFLEHLNSTRMEHVVDLTDGSAFPWQRYLRSSDTFKVDASKHCCCDTTGHQGPRAREDGGSSCARRVSEVLRLGRASSRATARARARVDELLGRLGLVASG